ncbi:hypothetical protein BJP41_08655 [Candidatus Williamhamiltonella defendens]|uniref:Uncharacterized protein n=1 Tax=Candidatus Williamhamiltonella defendens TaxID=138072 RepID=A0A2D3T3K3_9ENTR|nr:hypothetical protein [Candidatus Hamiltonella defensa]ATW30375.1 hypothetical protein BJP41_08655 [Candidatus Hamiltonella defensa]
MNLALLTGQRLGDIERMQWQDIHDGKWRLHCLINKNSSKDKRALFICTRGFFVGTAGLLSKCPSAIASLKRSINIPRINFAVAVFPCSG